MVLLLADKQGCVGGNVEQEREREREGERERDLGWQGQSSPVTFLDDASMPFDCPPSLQYLESTHPPFSLLFRLPLSLPPLLHFHLTLHSSPPLPSSLSPSPFLRLSLIHSLSYTHSSLLLLLFSPSLVVLDRRCIKKHKKRVTTCSTPLRIHITITALKSTRSAQAFQSHCQSTT
ncbi:hypothetical protein BKA57DRAFT_132219 [Linnemannia elongata]|nr:hypothetical protein BKA57DRAFT_132219 [Linnemannia elongata]